MDAARQKCPALRDEAATYFVGKGTRLVHGREIGDRIGREQKI